MVKIIAIIGFLICLMVVVPLVIFLPTLGIGRFMLASSNEKEVLQGLAWVNLYIVAKMALML